MKKKKTYTILSTASFNFTVWIHRHHWATDECTYMLKTNIQLVKHKSSRHILIQQCNLERTEKTNRIMSFLTRPNKLKLIF